MNYLELTLLYWGMIAILGAYHFFKPRRKHDGQPRMGRTVPNRIR